MEAGGQACLKCGAKSCSNMVIAVYIYEYFKSIYIYNIYMFMTTTCCNDSEVRLTLTW